MGMKDKKTILIAEDEAINRMYLGEILKDKGYAILEAEDGEEAVQQCKDHSEINLVLMDVKMPNLNGYEAAEQIRRFNSTVVLILQSAFISRKEELDDPKNIFQDVISKPVNESVLFNMLEKYLT
jgi:CheY-like chemotaxis protein